MKKLNFLMFFVLILVATGCSKEETTDQIEEQTTELDFVFKSDNNDPRWEAELNGQTLSYKSGPVIASTQRNNGNSGHTHGSFPGVSFSGTQNNGGTHGSATANLGPWMFTMETECVMVDGNEAVYGGTITNRVGPPPPPGAPFNIGDNVYFKVFDNGQGSNADPDQFYGSLKFRPNSECGIYTPDNADVWPPTVTIMFPWGPVTINFIRDVPEPGSIKVNN